MTTHTCIFMYNVLFYLHSQSSIYAAEYKYHLSENNAVMILIKDAGCDELLKLDKFIFYGEGAGSKVFQ